MIRITGNVAITLAGQRGLVLVLEAGPWGPGRTTLRASEAELLSHDAQEAVWLEVSAGDYAHFLTDEAVENLGEIGDAVLLALWDGQTEIEVAYHTVQEYAVRDHQDGQLGEWAFVRGHGELLEHIAGLVDRLALRPVA